MLIVETETMVAIRIVIKLTSPVSNVEMRLISLRQQQKSIFIITTLNRFQPFFPISVYSCLFNKMDTTKRVLNQAKISCSNRCCSLQIQLPFLAFERSAEKSLNRHS